jgi:hypothetical protein
MNPVTEADVKRLLEEESDVCVSIYMPTVKSGPEIQQNPIKFKNALRKAEKALHERVDHKRAKRMLAPAEKLLEETRFWNQQSLGLAVHLSDGFFHTYRLAIPVQDLITIGKRFHLKPMLALLDMRARFYVLVLSQNLIQLLDCTPYSVSPMEVPSMPHDIADALQEESEKQLQFHTGTGSAKGGRAAAFHGQGAGKDVRKDKLLRYFRTVNSHLEEVLKNQDVPLVLACVDYLFPIYQEANTFARLYSEALTGNFEEERPESVKDQAWELVKPHFQKYQEEALREFRELAHTERTSEDLRKILPASFEGRVQALFVNVGEYMWGRYDPVENQVVLHESKESGDEDLMNLAATETLRKGGSVHVVTRDEISVSGKLVFAVFRY